MIKLASLGPRDDIPEVDTVRPAEMRALYHELLRENTRLRREAQERSDERMTIQALIDWVPDILWVKDIDSRFVIANKSAAAKIGRGGPETLVGKRDFELHPMETAQQYYDDEQAILRSGRPLVEKEEYVIDAFGRKTWILTTKVPLRNEKGEICGLVGVSHDITERRRADLLRLGQSEVLEMIATSAELPGVLEHLVRLIEDQMTDIVGSISLCDKDGKLLRLAAAPNLAEDYRETLGAFSVGPQAGSCGAAIHRGEAVIVADIASDPLWQECREAALRNGYRSCWSTPIMSHQGAALGVFALYSRTVREPTESELRLIDAATRLAGIAIERKRTEDRIQFLADHDVLTGLPHRGLLNDRLAQALRYADRYDRWTGLLFVDLDNFKLVNDSLGHNAGDQLLKAVSERMVKAVRATDSVIRIGGDEFVIILFDQPKNMEAIAAIVQKVRAVIAEPLHIAGHDLRVTPSIGLAIYPKDGADAEELLANADAAMYHAKEAGRDNCQFYSPELNTKGHERFELQSGLRDAIGRSEFFLLYQPQIDLRTGSIFGVEALIRWRHPQMGIVPPNIFIPIAEQNGLIVQIGDWVLHEACRQNKAWQEAGLPPMTVSVNVSARQFRERKLIDRVKKALADSGLAPRYLELELTESLVMQDVEAAVAMMKQLQILGVQLSIDDFGIGYSSLSALKKFPVSRLKIDKSFIDEIANSENDKALATAVITIGQMLNIRVIAEGVETADQITFLRENNCDEVQGYHFSKPVSPQEIANLIDEAKWLRQPAPLECSDYLGPIFAF